jgi:hypothetical protein
VALDVGKEGRRAPALDKDVASDGAMSNGEGERVHSDTEGQCIGRGSLESPPIEIQSG